jgi:DNA-directed RNA polymerase subunit M/transcription elongation factor TFIIS
MDPQPTSQFRPKCYRCATGHGRARTWTMKGTERTIMYECNVCYHTWMSTDVVPSVDMART